MPDSNLSRREWLERLSVPAVGVSVGAALSPSPVYAAPDQASASVDALNGARTYNVRDHGAKGDGKTLDTAALQAAIDACNRDGGGTVLVPAGTFHIGTIELKSNVTLHLAAAATLLGSADGKQYHAVDAIPLRGDSTLGDGNWALIFAVDARNVTIEGTGLIDGQGLQFHSPERGVPPPSGLGGNQRPYHLLFHRCEHLRVQHIRLFQSAYHSVRVIQSKHVLMDGLHIYNRVNNNDDGFHFVSCESRPRQQLHRPGTGRRVRVVRQLQVRDGHQLHVQHAMVRIPLRRGHCREHHRLELRAASGLSAARSSSTGAPAPASRTCRSRTCVLQDVTGPISISVGPSANATAPPGGHGGGVPNDTPPGIVRNISFSNIHGTVTTDPPPLSDVPFTSQVRPGEGHSCIVLNAVGDAVVENISFSNVHLTFGGGGTAEDAARRDLPEVAGEYFMLGPMPAYGLYARSARRDASERAVPGRAAGAPTRLILDHVVDAAINGLSVEGNPQSGIGAALHRQQGRLHHGDACAHAVIRLPPARRLRESAHHD